MAADLVLGVDPGLDGALALVEAASGELVEVYDMPVLKLKKGRELSEYELARIIDNHAHEIAEAWVERVWAWPGEREVQAFAFGRWYGTIRGVICASFLPLREVPPITWKRGVGLQAQATKDDSRAVAIRRWPSQAERWKRVGDHGRADAALIADYGRKQMLRAAA